MKAQTVETTTGKKVRTLDNPLNEWVRSIDDGKWYKVAK